ncbi:MBL fold metallo-hydrolase [Arcticibacter eurypsychrophilus]|uniref:MBL fold metallo-hydrolase n=1 Tax=Arcticibacter eurypsychrophilus TaxID=1434752 RepID=UPI000A7C3D1F|nr:MBL fold metallo-hydrolase [Arcticibacter eurypsychrophilus]
MIKTGFFDRGDLYMRKRLIKIMAILFTTVFLIAFAVLIFMRQPQFGKSPSGKRLELMMQSPNYRDGAFQNIHDTPQLTEGYSMTKILYQFLFKKTERLRSLDSLPSVKTNLLNLTHDKDVLVWFGHSSYFMQIANKRFLVDPVFSGSISPIPGSGKAFKGADIYTVDDLPEIDYLFISHDHYDHMDYETIIKLRSKVKKVICGLGVGAHFEHWGYSAENIIEKDWDQQIDLGDGFVVNTAFGRHFSGRTFKRNGTLWMSYILKTPDLKIFIGGDSGYDTHFAEIGKKYGPFDLAILENGQYGDGWKYIHMTSREVLQAGKDLNAKRVFPVHSSKFVLANHPWDEPLKEITKLAQLEGTPLITPMIGEVVCLMDDKQIFTQWWKGVN